MFLIFIVILILLTTIILFIRKTIMLYDIVYKYEKIIDDLGKKNHEYNNQLQVLLGYIDNKDKLKEYLYTIIEDHRTGQNYEIRQLASLPKGGIKELLYYKMYKMKKNKINCSLYISKEIGKIIEEFDCYLYRDLTMLLGVFIDNAIEAAIKKENKEVYIDFKKEDYYLIIEISNTYDVEYVSKKRFSTKGGGHGYGLLLTKDINRRNNKIEIVTDHDDKMFKQMILIDLK